MNYTVQNSFIVPGTPEYTVIQYQPVPGSGASASRMEDGGDTITYSYSHGKPSNSSHVMRILQCDIVLPELADGDTHTIIAKGSVDDSMGLTVNEKGKESGSGSLHDFELKVEKLCAGSHRIAVSHSNIDYYPDPTGNVSVINGTVGPCPRASIVPDENIRVENDCGCGCETPDSDAGGATPAAAARNATATPAPFGSSSAGRGIIRVARLQYMRWACTFGAFRGMGGIPQGRLELIGYRYTPGLLSPAALAYRHPVASSLTLPAGGLAPNRSFRIHEGGAYTNYLCDANGSTAYGIGATTSTTDRAAFVTALSRGAAATAPLAQATWLRHAKTDGSATFYSLATGKFAAWISPEGTLLTAETAALHLAILREQNGTIRQIWNYWDGLADIVPAADSGYTISLYLPNQITGQHPATGLYTVTGAPFQTYAIGGNADTRTLTVSERDHTLPEGTPPYLGTWTENDGAWSITKGQGADAISETRIKTELGAGGNYTLTTTLAKGGIEASVIRETYLSHPLGELLLSRTEGYGSAAAQTTAFEHDDAGRIVRRLGPGSGETRTIHDPHGRATITAHPWAGGQNRIVNTTYRSDADTWNAEPAQTDTSYVGADGLIRLHLREKYAYSIADSIKRIEKRSEANGQTRLETLETWQGDASNPHARGRLRMTQAIDGIQTWYDYAPAAEHGALYTVSEETRIGGQPIPGHSTRTTAWIDAQGNTLRTEQHILDSEGRWQPLAAADYEHDNRNRWTKRTRSNGRTTTRAHICTGDLLRETDENGVTTAYGYDTARQLVETVRTATATTPETVTSYERNARGQALRTRKDTGPMATVETAAYDLLGRLTAQTDILGRTTACAYSADGLTDTLTTPAGATLITERHPDGSLARQHGTGQRELRHAYDYNNARIRHTVTLADRATVLSQTLENGFGETVALTTPTTVGYLYDRTVYNNKGQIVQRQRDTGSGTEAVAMAPILYEHDAFGNLAKETWKLADAPTLANSRITTWAYRVEPRADGIYRLSIATKNNGKGTTYTETAAQLLSEHPTLETCSQHTGPRGSTTADSTEYGDGAARHRKRTTPASNIAATATDIDGYTVSQTDHAGNTSTATRAWTATGLRLTQTDGRGNTTVTLTDIAGRPISATDAAGHTTATQYCTCCDTPACITDALGHTASYAYDHRGRKTAEWGTAIQPARYAYDETDRLTALTTWRADEGNIETDPTERTDGDTTNWAYHPATGQETCKTYADGTTVRREYNVLGLIGHLHNARGNNATCIYATATGLLKEIIHSDGTPGQQNTWNHLGNLYRIVDAQGTRDITYNNYNEKETESITVSGIKHTLTETYDALGRPAGYTLDKAGSALDTVSWRYGTDGRLNAATFLHAGEEKAFAYGYLPGSNLIRTLAHPNGLLATRSYETQRDLPTAIDTTRGATGVALRSYSYDALGRPATRTLARQGATRQDTFAYNTRSELESAALGTDPYAYTYDNIGNRTTAQEQTTETAYDANRLNQYTAIALGVEEPFLPAYDADGNQTTVKTQTGTWTVACNADNRPTRYTSADGATVIENGYDYMGRRYMKKVTVNGTVVLHQHYLYRGYLQIAAIDLMRANAPTLWLLHWDPTQPIATRPLSLRKNGTWYTYGHDLTKNVTELYTTAGAIVTEYAYTPYGTVTASGLEQPIQWSSEHYDAELGMVYYNYRHYNPLDGRWINRDPIMEQGGYNLYGFVENAVYAFLDILGQWPWSQGQPEPPQRETSLVKLTQKKLTQRAGNCGHFRMDRTFSVDLKTVVTGRFLQIVKTESTIRVCADDSIAYITKSVMHESWPALASFGDTWMHQENPFLGRHACKGTLKITGKMYWISTNPSGSAPLKISKEAKALYPLGFTGNEIMYTDKVHYSYQKEQLWHGDRIDKDPSALIEGEPVHLDKTATPLITTVLQASWNCCNGTSKTNISVS